MHAVSAVPNPWVALERTDLVLVRAPIAEPGRYYHHHGVIVVRSGLLLEQERRVLWHELTHHRRGDTSCEGWLAARMEASVEREAARRAMPTDLLGHLLADAVNFEDLVWRCKVPAEWVRFRLDIAHPAERRIFAAAQERNEAWAA